MSFMLKEGGTLERMPPFDDDYFLRNAGTLEQDCRAVIAKDRLKGHLIRTNVTTEGFQRVFAGFIR